ncbi:MAG: hypothetical protein JWL73_2633 [Actinomycetia bacterium]|nr:hypothetical protein [Actinomycetes bacterium]
MASAPLEPTGTDGAVALLCTVRAVSRTVIVRLQHDVGPDAESPLQGLVDGLGDEGYRDAVIDVADIDPVDAAGLWVLARIADNVRNQGGTLVLRSASPATRHVLEISALSEFLAVEPQIRAAADPGPAPGLGGTDGRVDLPDEEVAHHLLTGLRMRETIAQAQGVLMARDSVSADAAYDQLRRWAERDAVAVQEMAARIVSSVTAEVR